jgi:hypothetical protein
MIFEVERRGGLHSLLSLHRQRLFVREGKFVRAEERGGYLR